MISNNNAYMSWAVGALSTLEVCGLDLGLPLPLVGIFGSGSIGLKLSVGGILPLSLTTEGPVVPAMG